jgi:hypothetical protein
MRFGLKDTTIQTINNVFADYPQVDQVVVHVLEQARRDVRTASDSAVPSEEN